MLRDTRDMSLDMVSEVVKWFRKSRGGQGLTEVEARIEPGSLIRLIPHSER